MIAFYLPQFHPNPVNDKFWGEGFTEWTNVAKARPLFRGHYQPRIPADLGFYDLRLPEVRMKQAELAKDAGIEGFCYWHYWFGSGVQTLEGPLNAVAESGEPDFPFCIGWANHSWTTGSWSNITNTNKHNVIFEQTYPGVEDHIAHFNAILHILKDRRYIKIQDKPLVYIWNPTTIPDGENFIKLWQKLAIENNLGGIYFVARVDPVRIIKQKGIDYKRMSDIYQTFFDLGYDAINSYTLTYAELRSRSRLKNLLLKFTKKFWGDKIDYLDIVNNMVTLDDYQENIFPQLIPGRDRSPRVGKDATIYHKSTPEKFRTAIKNVLACVSDKEYEKKVVFLNSWNEWAEGSYVEPDLKYGKSYLVVLKEELCDF